MRKRKVKAVFLGANNSCGYKTNEEYIINIYHERDMFVQIEKSDSVGGFCDYESMIAFLENWDNIRNV